MKPGVIELLTFLKQENKKITPDIFLKACEEMEEKTEAVLDSLLEVIEYLRS